jgi:leucyl aminopeptidase
MIVSYKEMAEQISGLVAGSGEKAIPIRSVNGGIFLQNMDAYISPAQAAWLRATGWDAKPGSTALLPGENGIEQVLVAIDADDRSPGAAFQIGGLPQALPEGTYELADFPGGAENALFAWLMGSYSFQRYFTYEKRKPRRLVLPEGMEPDAAMAKAQAVWFARELINLPANDLGPSDLAAALKDLGQNFGAEVSVIGGDDLLAANFPLIHSVGRSSDRAPCLADLTWGDPAHPKITLVGKGICFDTGGLDIKPPQAMALMKKDMGGAATVMALGAMIIAARLPVRLRILIAAADNNISGNAFRPGDIIKSRAGMTVEIANTDAEGRLVLADALALADEEEPDLLIDIATLTGAARVALGPDLPPFYTDDEALAVKTYAAGLDVADPLWRLPFWMLYDSYLKSEVADVNHIYNGSFAGSITAALFLKRFVKKAKRYMHLDIYAWNQKAAPGKPAGGEPQGARALFEVIRGEFGKSSS